MKKFVHISTVYGLSKGVTLDLGRNAAKRAERARRAAATAHRKG